MRILIAAVGRAKSGPERALYQHFQDRIKWRLDLKEVEDRRPLPAAKRREREAELLLATLPAGAMLCALDAKGKMLSSDDFATKISAWQDAGVKNLVFAIGGADGHGEALLGRADLVLSLGPMTWPHLVARGLLAEQIYRAQQIIAGHPYHRG